MDFNDFEEICESTIILNPIKIKKRKTLTFSDLLGLYETPQSIKINLGHIFEKIIRNFSSKYSNKDCEFKNTKYYIDINTGELHNKNKGNKELDFLSTIGDIIYYFEIKTNLDLDTEKSEFTIKKVNTITSTLNKKFNKQVIGGVLSPFYSKYDNYSLSGNMKNYKDILFFMEDFFKIYNIKTCKEQYENYLKKLGVIINETII